MRKIATVLLLLTLACFNLAGCAGQNQETGGQSEVPVNSGDTSAKEDSGLTLDKIRQAAEDSGYTVSDGHNLAFMKNVKDGFSVQIVADEQDVIYSILECQTEDAAIHNAKEIDDAGYNIAIRNGRFLTCYDVDNKDGTAKDILASLLQGKPAAVK